MQAVSSDAHGFLSLIIILCAHQNRGLCEFIIEICCYFVVVELAAKCGSAHIELMVL